MKFFFVVAALFFSIAAFLESCDRVSLTGGGSHEAGGCQSCHRSPPSSGEHYYHLYTQTLREQITCIECHGTSIKKMLWKQSVKRSVIRDMKGFQSSMRDGSRITLISSRVYQLEFSLCTDTLRGDSLFEASYDTLGREVMPINSRDSLVTTDMSYILFRYDTSRFVSDTIEIKQYLNPKSYDNCKYRVTSRAIVERNTGPKTVFLELLTPLNSPVIHADERKLYFWYPDTNSRRIDTITYRLRRPEDTFLGEIPAGTRAEFLTDLDGGPFVLRDSVGDAYQLRNDTLFKLVSDSIIQFGDEPFAEHTKLHGDGKIDINFIHEPFTYFVEEVAEEITHPITGESQGQKMISVGSWSPVRKSCWTGGIPNGTCHRFMDIAETFWYNDRIPDWYEIKFKED